MEHIIGSAVTGGGQRSYHSTLALSRCVGRHVKWHLLASWCGIYKMEAVDDTIFLICLENAMLDTETSLVSDHHFKVLYNVFTHCIARKASVPGGSGVPCQVPPWNFFLTENICDERVTIHSDLMKGQGQVSVSSVVQEGKEPVVSELIYCIGIGSCIHHTKDIGLLPWPWISEHTVKPELTSLCQDRSYLPFSSCARLR